MATPSTRLAALIALRDAVQEGRITDAHMKAAWPTLRHMVAALDVLIAIEEWKG
jgi:hypothetical protein